MSDDLEAGNASAADSSAKSSVAEPKPAAVLAAAPVPTDKWSVRRAELKRQKRRAHRRRINASNTPG